MPAAIKPEWLARLRAIDPQGELRFNTLLNRWEVRLVCADGLLRSQFWGWFTNPLTGERIPPDPVTGLPPFRDLDDRAMDEMCANLERTFVANRHDGAGTPRKEILRRMRYNQELGRAHYRRLGQEFEDRVRERRRRLLGHPQIVAGIDLKRSA